MTAPVRRPGDGEDAGPATPAKGWPASVARLRIGPGATAFVGAAAMFVLSNQGLFRVAWLEQPSVLAGIVAGCVAAGWWQAAALAAAGVLAGSLVQTPRLFGDLAAFAPLWWRWMTTMLVWAAGSGALVALARAAVIGRWGRGAERRFEWVAAAVAFAIVAGGLVATVWSYDTAPMYSGASIVQGLDTRPVPGTKMSDDQFYADTLWLMRQRGMSYYEAFRTAYHENAWWASDPPFFLSYRLPTIFWLFAALPGGTAILVAILVLAVAGLAAATAIAAVEARPALAIVATAAVASYLAEVLSEHFLLHADVWAAPLVLIAAAFTVGAARSERWRTLTVLAVACAVAATVVREIAGFLLIGGLVAAAFGPRERRRFAASAWAAGLLAVGVAVLAHAMAVDGAVSGAGAGWLLRPSLLNAASALLFSTQYLAREKILVATLMALGIVGAAASRVRGTRVFALLVLAMPLAAFAVLNNGGADQHGNASNYWGLLVSPLIYAFVPWALARLDEGGSDRHADPVGSELA